MSVDEFEAFYGSLGEKPTTTIRLFDKQSSGSEPSVMCYNQDAKLLAGKFFNSTGVLKTWGALQYVSLSPGTYEAVLREILLNWHYRVELYVKDRQRWMLSKRASPGNLAHFEDILFPRDEEASISSDVETSSYIVAIRLATNDLGNLVVGVAFVDVIMRELMVQEFIDSSQLAQLESVLFRKGPKEAIVEKGTVDKVLGGVLERANLLVTEANKKSFETSTLEQDLASLLLRRKSQPELNVAAMPEMELAHASRCLAACIRYLDLTTHYENQFTLRKMPDTSFMRLDCSAIKALHLLPDPAEGVTKDMCLLGLLNRCRTGPGQRLLQQYLRQPLVDRHLIEERLDCVELLINATDTRHHLQENHLRKIPDVQRLAARLQKRKASLQDVYKVYCGVQMVQPLHDLLSGNEQMSHHAGFTQRFLTPLQELANDLGKYLQMVETTMDLRKVDECEFRVNPEFNESLKDLSSELSQFDDDVEKMLNSIKRKLGLDSVKLEKNSQHGYCFRVGIKEDKLLRDNSNVCIWLDSKKDGIRFTTEPLQRLTEDYRDKLKQYDELQALIADKIIEIAVGYLEPLSRFSLVVADLDVLTSLAVVSVTAADSYVRPKVLPSGNEIVLQSARHPCLENQPDVFFIPNDITLDRENQQFVVITGPNMGGKSTYIRTVGVVCLMAQIGCFVPASSATVSILDAIMARIGAGDQIEKGVSTFMAEMLETNSILNCATENSLVIIDELGRGTSTFDGFGLAWAISQHLVTETNCYCLFATHFHELTKLAEHHSSVKNFHFTAQAEDGHLTMLYKVQPGACDRSFGIHVGRMVDFPADVLQSAEAKAAQLEWPLPLEGDPVDDNQLVEHFLDRVDSLDPGLSEWERDVTVKKMMNKIIADHPNSGFSQVVSGIFNAK